MRSMMFMAVFTAACYMSAVSLSGAVAGDCRPCAGSGERISGEPACFGDGSGTETGNAWESTFGAAANGDNLTPEVVAGTEEWISGMPARTVDGSLTETADAGKTETGAAVDAGKTETGAAVDAGETITVTDGSTEASTAVSAEDVPDKVVITGADSLRATELVSDMTLEEKIDYIAGVKSFILRPVERLGIPEIRLADGPQGIRNNTKSTLYPCGILAAATWNRALAERFGHGLGQDARARGVHILLGPGVNIYRAPMCGRNYEYMGEDPYLTSETAKHYILGVQEEGVMAVVKHFAANNQLEYMRHSASSDVDERTLNEIYFPAFRKAVQEAGVGSVMDAYNLLWGQHCTENPYLNIEVLRNRWGFKGIVMSDWTSVYSSSGAANAGLDLECPVGVYFTRDRLLPLIENGVVSERTIDEKVQHLLQTFSAFGFLDRTQKDTTIALDNAASRQTALDIAREGIVLLKNEDGNLPVGKRDRILVMGPNADVITTGGGSGFVTPYSTVSVYRGLSAVHGGSKVSLLPDGELYRDILDEVFTDRTYSSGGFRADYYCNVRPEGDVFKTVTEPDPSHSWGYSGPFEGMPEDKFSVRWSGVYKAGRDGTVRVQMAGDDGYRLFVNGKNTGGDWGNHSISNRAVFFDVKAGMEYELVFEFFDNAGEAKVVFDMGIMDETVLENALSEASEVVFCAGFNSSTEGEGWERTFALPKDQTDLISRVASMHDRVTVVLNAGGGVDFSGWSDGVESILMAWYPGQEGGTAVAEILTGRISPSGKLPISIEKAWEDNPVHDSYYANKAKRVTYTEGVFVGYRGYDRRLDAEEVWRTGKSLDKGLAYPFGYGLSYTTFEYGGLSVKKLAGNSVEVSFDVTNTGRMEASETAQIYVGDVDASVPRPLKELKGYEKLHLKPGQTGHVSVVLDDDAFSFFDVNSGKFIVEPGLFRIYVGPSSADLPLRTEIML